MQWLSELVASPLWAVITLAVPLAIGVFFSWLFYWWSKRDREPCYAIRNMLVLEEYREKVTIHYHGHGEDFKNLSHTYVAFWNNGSATIEKSAIVKDDQIRVVYPAGVAIVDSHIVQTSRDVIQFSCTVTKEKNTAILSFEFLDEDDGAVIGLLHTGSLDADAQVLGTIKGAKHLKQAFRRDAIGREGRKKYLNLVTGFLWVALALAICAAVGLGFALLMQYNELAAGRTQANAAAVDFSRGVGWGAWGFATGGIIPLGFVILRRFFSRRLPATLAKCERFF
jgi:hypothetical protein